MKKISLWEDLTSLCVIYFILGMCFEELFHTMLKTTAYHDTARHHQNWRPIGHLQCGFRRISSCKYWRYKIYFPNWLPYGFFLRGANKYKWLATSKWYPGTVGLLSLWWLLNTGWAVSLFDTKVEQEARWSFGRISCCKHLRYGINFLLKFPKGFTRILNRRMHRYSKSPTQVL